MSIKTRPAVRPPERKSRARREYAVYRPAPDWPGITDGFDARCSCTWAPRRGRYEIKRPNRSCWHRVHAAAAQAGQI